jgi:uncharacterized protein (DUF1501 family)
MTMRTIHRSRRHFLRSAGTLAALPFVPGFAKSLLAASAAAPGGDYRALVCVFLYGGNDCHNLVIPTGASEWTAYASKRGAAALSGSDLLPLLPTNGAGRTFAVPSSMPRLQSLFNETRTAAIVGNVGVLTRPTTVTEYNARSASLPPLLFSHSDMQCHWQSGTPGAPFTTGWGGRMADRLHSTNGAAVMPMSVSLAGSNQLMVSALTEAAPYQVGRGGPFAMRAYRDFDTGPGNPQQFFEERIAVARKNQLEEAYGEIVARSFDIAAIAGSALGQVGSFRADFPGTGSDASPGGPNDLADQLRMVARLVATRATLGTKRQLFFVGMNGFDTHGGDAAAHARLLGILDEALGAFHGKMAELGVDNNVTTFTASEFGRTYTSNGHGTDHGWGGHQLVVGGAVRGGTLYGAIPVAGVRNGVLTLIDPATAQSVDVGQGRLLPTTAVDTYAATLARWMGVTGAQDLKAVLPNIGNFASSNLGFFG